jgi:NAD(P)-dependent dehydrogenase (short-subunit alcohol dehydrogenase family)
MGEFNGQVVAVIGATGGLGRAITQALRNRSATVITVNRSGGADVRLDLRDASAGDALVDYVKSAHHRLDGVVVAAGIVAFGDLVDTDDVSVEELLLTNTMGPIWLAKRLAPLLTDSHGFFVNVSGVVAETPMPSMVAYSASKAAASAATLALAKEWRRRRIRVIDVRPPHTETGLATRPLEGTAPAMPAGLDPRVVAERIVDAIVDGERELSGADFGNGERRTDGTA